VVAAGLEISMGSVLRPTGIDLTVLEAGIGDMMMSRVSSVQLEKIHLKNERMSIMELCNTSYTMGQSRNQRKWGP
jgi:hypothetical protein